MPIETNGELALAWETNMADQNSVESGQVDEHQHSDESFRALIEHSPHGIALLSAQGTLQYVSPSTYRILGYSPEEVIGRDLAEITHPDDLPALLALLNEAIQRPGHALTHTYRFRHHTGAWRWLEATFHNLFQEPSVQALVFNYHDITEHQQAEKALQRHAARLIMLNDVGSRIAAELDVEQVLSIAARLIHEKFGYHHVGLFVLDRERNELVMRARAGAFTHLFSGEYRLPVTEGMVGWVTRQGRSLLANDVRAEPTYVNRGGDQIPTQSELTVPIQIGGQVLGVLDIQSPQLNAFDDTDVLVMQMLADQIAVALENARLYEAVRRELDERKRSEAALRESEVRFRTRFEGGPIGLYRTTEQGQILEANEALVRMLGYPDRESLLAANVIDMYVDVGDRRRMQERLEQDGVARNIEIQLRRYDGAIFWAEDNVRLIRDPAGRSVYYEGSLQDITDRTAREQELEAIAIVSAALRAAPTRAKMLPIVLDQINKLLAVDGVSIAMRDPATGESVFEMGRGTGETYVGQRIPPGAGVIGHVIAAGRTYLTNDVSHDPTFLWPQRLGQLQAVACVPLVAQEQTIGALWVGRRTSITPIELRVLEAIANIAGNAIHRIALFEAERRQRVLAESLRDTAAALSSTLNVDEVLDHILSRAQHVVPHDYAQVMLIEANRAYVVRDRGRAQSAQGEWIEIDRRPQLKQIQETGQPLIIPDTRDYSAWPRGLEAAWVRSYAGIPIRVKGRVVGFLVFASATPGFFVPADSERAQAFADQAAVAIENAQLYQEIRRYAEELETRVADRTRELTEANRQLQELDRLKSKFVSDVSHELRTPLTSLALHAELLENARPDRRDHYVRALQEQTRRLMQLVEDILNLSRLELGADRVKFGAVDLNALVESVVEAHRPSADAAGLELTFLPDAEIPAIRGELNQLAQVVTNLVANAINYTPRGSVRIRTYPHSQQVCLEAQDTGLGIDPEDMPHLFDRFYRGQQATKSKVRGTGLGLAIVKEIVELHSGTIEVESRVGQGSIFRVCLPTTDPTNQSLPRAQGETA